MTPEELREKRDYARINAEIRGENINENVSDVTTLVKFQENDGESLPLTQCVCGKKFDAWDFILGVYQDNPTRCKDCGREFFFSVEIRVYQVEGNDS